MAKSKTVRCPCHGNPACKLCGGTKFYQYQPTERGWMPITCPTCQGATPQERRSCVTCRGDVWVDPANPPFDPGVKGDIRKMWKLLFGGG